MLVPFDHTYCFLIGYAVEEEEEEEHLPKATTKGRTKACAAAGACACLCCVSVVSAPTEINRHWNVGTI
jgi:hypothetical protein